MYHADKSKCGTEGCREVQVDCQNISLSLDSGCAQDTTVNGGSGAECMVSVKIIISVTSAGE